MQNNSINNCIIFIIIVLLISNLIKRSNCVENFTVLPYNKMKVNHYNSVHSLKNKDVGSKFKAFDPELPLEDHPEKITQRDVDINKCMKDKVKDYKHSKKQSMGPVEYTNNKTHIGPQNDFHKCFANGTHNLRDLGWHYWKEDYNSLDKFNINNLETNQSDNPAMKNYLNNMNKQFLNNLYL